MFRAVAQTEHADLDNAAMADARDDITNVAARSLPHADRQTIRSLARPLVALLAIALVFRPQTIAIGPLLPSIQNSLDISHGVAGALTGIPVLCMGIFAPLGPVLARRLGARSALAVCALLVIAFGLLRLGVPGAPALLVL